MSKDCEHMNPLIRGGTSQGERYPEALRPDFVKVDEKSMLDLLAFIKKYAGEYSYYGLNNKADGSWEIFFNDNIASRLAAMASFNINDAIAALLFLSDKINNGPHYKKHLKGQFDLLFSLLYKIELWSRNAAPELLVYRDLIKEVGSTLSLELLHLVSYYKVAIDLGLINADDYNENSIFPTLPTENILLTKGFSSDWFRFVNKTTQKPYTSWQLYMAAIEKSEIYEPTGGIAEMAIYSQDFLMKSMERISSSYSRLAKQTGIYVDDILENYSAHEPHIGLLLAFLNLFKYAQDEINTITARHLDFYLKDVLQLDYQPAVPDKAHVIFVPAKDTIEHKIDANTALSAGKDTLGKEVLFYTGEEKIVNQAQIDSIRNIYIDKDGTSQVYASPIANSSDGTGTEFEEEPGKWKPFGESQIPDDRSMPDASIGFLVTSDIFLLKEDLRKIKIDLVCKSKLIAAGDNISEAKLRVLISGEKGWIKKEYSLKAVSNETDFNDNEGILIYQKTIRINTKVNAEQPPIVKLDTKLHDARFTQASAGVFIECVVEGTKPSAFKFLKKAVISAINISTKASSKSDFILQNDQLLIDPAKPFMPFGTSPKAGASFIIGSHLFSNNITKLTLKGTWNNLPDEGIEEYYKNLDSSINHNSFKVKRYSLKNGEWIINDSDKESDADGENIFKGDKNAGFDHDFLGSDSWKVSDGDADSKKFDIKTKGGYIKLVISDNKGFGFGHARFPKKYAEQAIIESGNVNIGGAEGFTQSLPNEPYTPLLSDFSISFEASASISLDSSTASQYNNNDGKIYQVHPFGVYEMHPYLKLETLKLFPQFSSVDGESDDIVEHTGQIIIGLKNLEPPTSLNLLFKMAEGSEDPELQRQKIIWSYLSDNHWIPFQSNEILEDATRDLTGTGILSLAIPKEATSNNSILPAGCIYLMGTIEKNTNAACQIIDILPQAILSTFSDNGNDPARLALPALAGSISKMKVKDEKIKSVSQPYASFGGKMQENAEGFYLRTAERLRHKSRGISIWDYERLILQEFPDIYKVKCINHTAYGPYGADDVSIDAEFAPGYVTIIVIPTTYNQNAINPYEPKVTRSRIQDIEEFIKGRISPFAAEKLKVLNPQYEQIKLEFEVAFHTQYTDRGFYEKQLNEDIKRHLSPWAFEEGREITLGSALHRSTLIDFIEELYYVDYLKDFKMNRYTNNVLTDSDIEVALPSNARSAFVTINNKDYTQEHIIKEISK